MLTRRCSGEPPSASSCASASLNSRRPAKPRSRQVRMIVGTELPARSASRSKLSSSTRSGSSRISVEDRAPRRRAPCRGSRAMRLRAGRCSCGASSEVDRHRIDDAVVRRRPSASSATCRRWCRGARCPGRRARRRPARAPSSALPAQVGVLVVQAGDLPARRAPRWASSAPRARARDRDRQLDVEGEVAPPDREDRQARFGAGLHQRPDLERRAQALAAVAAQARSTALRMRW